MTKTDPRATEATLRSLLQLSSRDACEIASAIAASREGRDFGGVLDLAADLMDAEGVESDGEVSCVMAPTGTRTLYCVLGTGEFFIGGVR